MSRLLGGGPILEIHELKAQGVSIREISHRLGYSRNTVRKWLRARTPTQRKARAPQSSKLDPFKDYVRCRMAEGVYNTNKLYQEIKSRGYSGGKSILKSYVKPFRPPAKPSAVVRFDTLPGEQAQVDFGTFAYEDGLGRHRIYAFVMVLSWSRAMYVEFVEKCDLVTCSDATFTLLKRLGECLGQYSTTTSRLWCRDETMARSSGTPSSPTSPCSLASFLERVDRIGRKRREESSGPSDTCARTSGLA